jgi:hypothetical protein
MLKDGVEKNNSLKNDKKKKFEAIHLTCKTRDPSHDTRILYK